MDVPADRDFVVGVARGNSTSATDAIATFQVNFDIGKSYTVMAAGVVGSSEKPFNLFVDDNARETTAPGFSSISAFHGLFTPFVLGIDVNDRLAGVLFDNVDFGVYTPYLDLPNGERFLDVTLANFTDLLGTHRIDPTVFSDKPARIFTSGILGNDSSTGSTSISLPFASRTRWLASVAGRIGVNRTALRRYLEQHGICRFSAEGGWSRLIGTPRPYRGFECLEPASASRRSTAPRTGRRWWACPGSRCGRGRGSARASSACCSR